MQPLPKIVGVIAALAGAIVAIDPTILVPVLGDALTKTVIGVCFLIVALSHSLPGTGGK